MYWRHVVASTVEEREEFSAQEVNSDSYTKQHFGMIFDEGLSFSGFERDKVWLNVGDEYLDLSDVSGADDEGDGRAVAVADFDDDGDVDFFVHNIQRERHHLYRNDVAGQTPHQGIKIRLQASKGHPQAVGAEVIADVDSRSYAQVLAFGSGFVSQNAPELVFGLGTSDHATVRVRWPGRAEESFGALEAGQTYLLREGEKAKVLPRKTFQFRNPGALGLRVPLGSNVGTLTMRDAKNQESTVDWSGEELVLLNVWATYCAACLAEMPDLEKLEQDSRFEVIMVNADTEPDHSRCEQVLADRGVTARSLYITDEVMNRLFDRERLPLPTTLILTPDGTLEQVVQGPITSWSGWQDDESEQNSP